MGTAKRHKKLTHERDDTAAPCQDRPMADVLLVHGAWHGSWCWDDVGERLREQGHNVVAIDLPGHDRPGDRSRLRHSLGEYLEAVEAAAAKLDHPILVGHSMGSYLVQRHLEDHSARLGVLIAGPSSNGARKAAIQGFRRHPLLMAKCTLLFDLAPAVATVELVREAFFTDDTPAEIVAATHAKLQSESARAASAIQRRPLRPAKISTPMRVIAAQHDLLSPVDDQRELANDFNTDCHIVDGGHDLMLDTCWPQLADLLVQLIDDAPS